ncbi:MAG: hypothetical protein J3K34DRAFT_526363 [Monoraphidium minutum]|nr:MAG: hypothetical protein J3K34DRAFT_526363 [Monoraphidium minutum]
MAPRGLWPWLASAEFDTNLGFIKGSTCRRTTRRQASGPDSQVMLRPWSPSDGYGERVSMQLQHQGVLRFYGYTQVKNQIYAVYDDVAATVVEYVRAQTADRKTKVDWFDAKLRQTAQDGGPKRIQMSKQLGYVLRELSDERIVHNKIGCDTLFVDGKGNLKLSDFSAAHQATSHLFNIPGLAREECLNDHGKALGGMRPARDCPKATPSEWLLEPSKVLGVDLAAAEGYVYTSPKTDVFNGYAALYYAYTSHPCDTIANDTGALRDRKRLLRRDELDLVYIIDEAELSLFRSCLKHLPALRLSPNEILSHLLFFYKDPNRLGPWLASLCIFLGAENKLPGGAPRPLRASLNKPCDFLPRLPWWFKELGARRPLRGGRHDNRATLCGSPLICHAASARHRPPLRPPRPPPTPALL